MKKVKITVCIGSSCFVKGNADNIRRIERFIEERGLAAEECLELTGVGCGKFCEAGPVIFIDGKRHDHVDAEKLYRLLNEKYPDPPSPRQAASQKHPTES